jgi:hypothetical protein
MYAPQGHAASTTTSGAAKAGSAMSDWGCGGHAFTPEEVHDPYRAAYILFYAQQTCAGSFGVQRVCVQLQERDYFGNFYNRTAFNCSATTAGLTQTGVGTVPCSTAGHGTYRTRAQGYASIPFVGTSSGTSYSATLC